MPKVDEAAIGAARVVGGGTFIVSVLGTEAPLTGFPQGAFFDCVPWLISTTPEAIRELGFGSMSPLAQDGTAFQVIFPWFHVRWPLSGEDPWNALTAGGKESGCRRGRGTSDKEVLLEASANGA